jgi:type IV pilus assembly protein PilA
LAYVTPGTSLGFFGDFTMKKQSGFTLIELLLVLAIIGIISAIAVPAILSQRDRARDLSSVANCKNIMTSFLGIPDALEERGGVTVGTETISTVYNNTTLKQVVFRNDVEDTLFPVLYNARNPHNPTTAGYNTETVNPESEKSGKDTKGACKDANMGQVQFGVFPGDNTGSGTLVLSAVKLKKARSGAGSDAVFFQVQDL